MELGFNIFKKGVLGEMSEQQREERDSSENAPPKPDVPAPAPEAGQPEPGESDADKSPESARMKMADEVESGRSPYDYSAEAAQKSRPGKDAGADRSGGFSLANVAVSVSVVALLGAAFMGWKMFTDLTGEVDKMAVAVRELSEQLRSQKDTGRLAGKALARAELKRALVTLDGVIALGDPDLTPKAIELRDEALDILMSLEPGKAVQQKGEVAPETKESAAAPADAGESAAAPVERDSAESADSPPAAGDSGAPEAPAGVEHSGGSSL